MKYTLDILDVLNYCRACHAFVLAYCTEHVKIFLACGTMSVIGFAAWTGVCKICKAKIEPGVSPEAAIEIHKRRQPVCATD